MKLPRRQREHGVRFNVTPLIDICFNLIIFFALASVSLQREAAGGGIALPGACGVDSENSAAHRRLVITVDRARKIRIGGDEVVPSELDRLFAARDANGLEVRIRADKSVPYGDVKPIILACARQGITDVKFAVEGK